MQSVFKNSISELNSIDMNKLLIVSGTVIRLNKVKTLIKSKVFKCNSCGNELKLYAEHENYGQFLFPPKCMNTVSKEKKENFFAKMFF